LEEGGVIETLSFARYHGVQIRFDTLSAPSIIF